MCNADVCTECIDDYFKSEQLEIHPIISPNDLSMYVRNKRYEIIFKLAEDGHVFNKKINAQLDQWLDDNFGPQRQKGGNPKRSQARSFILKHDIRSFKRNYKQLEWLNILMKEVENYEQTK